MCTRKPNRSARAVAAAVLACLFVSSFAAAADQPAGRFPSTVVRFKDLNLAETKDVARLHRRIVYAARWVCRDTAPSKTGTQEKNIALCVDGAIEQAVRDVNRPALSALHRARMERLARR